MSVLSNYKKNLRKIYNIHRSIIYLLAIVNTSHLEAQSGKILPPPILYHKKLYWLDWVEPDLHESLVKDILAPESFSSFSIIMLYYTDC